MIVLSKEIVVDQVKMNSEGDTIQCIVTGDNVSAHSVGGNSATTLKAAFSSGGF